MRKFLFFVLVLFSLVVLGVLLSVRFFPQMYVAVFNHFSSEQASVDSLNIQFFPLSVKADGVTYRDTKEESLVTAKDLSFSAQPVSWLQGKRNFWRADIADVHVQLHKFPTSSTSAENEDSTSEKLDIHQILSGLNLKIDAVRIQLDANNYVDINYLNTALNDDGLSDYTLIEQEIKFSLDYVALEDVEKTLHVEGELHSKIVDGVSKLGLVIPSIDLSSMLVLNENAETAPAPKTDTESNEIVDTQESAVDWQWLSLFDPVELDLSVDEILWSKSSVRQMNVVLTLDQSIAFTQRSAIAWLDSEDLSFEDEISLTGQWKPISMSSRGADLNGHTEFKTSALTVSVAGDLNVNGVEGSDLLIKLSSTNVPVKSSALGEETLVLLEQYFPIDVEAKFKQADKAVGLNIESAQFGKSDISGSIDINSKNAELTEITADLQSETVSYITPADALDEEEKRERELKPLPVIVEGEEVTAKEPSPEVDNSERVFNDEPIDWSWLRSMALNTSWQAKQVLLDDIEINNLILPITLLSGELLVDNFTGDLGGGSFDASSKVLEQDGVGAVSIDMSASGVLLEKLNLLPPEELKKGVTDVAINLDTKGNTTHALASSLNGVIDISVGDGVIGNDSFELIGSDLILSLLNKLNPFAKTNKTTELECAIVNLKVDEGRINIDKSLALRTSKLTMVADGYVDLGTEKIKLSLAPKARSGVGVDVSSLVKFIALGGTLSKPAPTVTASGILKSAVVVGAAVSTGGVSLLATSAAEKTVANVDVCKRASAAFQ